MIRRSNVSSTIQKFIGVEPSGFIDAKGIFKNIQFLIEKQKTTLYIGAAHDNAKFNVNGLLFENLLVKAIAYTCRSYSHDRSTRATPADILPP